MSNKLKEKALMFLDSAANIVVKVTDGIQDNAARAVVRTASSVPLIGASLKMISEAYNGGSASVEPVISQSQTWQDVLLGVGGFAIGAISLKTTQAARRDFIAHKNEMLARRPTPGAADLRNQKTLPPNTLRNA